MPLAPGTRLMLCDEQEGWLPNIGPCLEGTVHQALPGEGQDNPLYVVNLDEPIEIPPTSSQVARGTPAGTYGKVVIKSRWRGFDAGNSSAVSVYVLLPPPGAIEEGRACVAKLPIILWASCSTLAGDA
jgi:hypothetical protein